MTAREPAQASVAAFRSLVRVSVLLRQAAGPHFAPFGITPSQWGALHTLYLAESEGLPELRLTDLGGRMLVRPPSITGVVDRLERRGLVLRTASADDLRAKKLSLTPAGRQLVQTIRKGHPQRIQAVLGGLTLREQAQLHRLLDRLGSHLGSLVNRTKGAASPVARRPIK
jgi:MarR family transcriptional regulator, 2-MHQ and catechol-resistance regulon repressor